MTSLDLEQRVRAISEFSSAAPLTSFAGAQFAAGAMQFYCTSPDPDIKRLAAHGIGLGLVVFTAGVYRTLRNYSD